MSFEVYTPDTAPEGAKDTLTQAEKNYGFLPNLLGVMAESPELLAAYATLSKQFSKTSFSTTEQQVVLLTVSHENGCGYCMAAHSTIAQMSGVPADVVEALRTDELLADKKLEALRVFTRSVVEQGGWVDEDEIDAFLASGYQRKNILEVILGVAMKTLSNYTNHVAETPVDEAFEANAWEEDDFDEDEADDDE